MAVDDDYIRNNPSDNVLRELRQAHCFKTEKRRALTRPEQELFLSYLKNTPAAQYWYPIFAVLVGTGLPIRLKADACTSSKELYEVYKMWCEENSLNAIKARGFSDALIANQRRYNLESTNNIVNSSGRRVRGFVGIEALVQPDLTPNGWRA